MIAMHLRHRWFAILLVLGLAVLGAPLLAGQEPLTLAQAIARAQQHGHREGLGHCIERRYLDTETLRYLTIRFP